MNKGLGAQAFTHGSDIYFNEGKYDPDSNSGKRLLAHESTHTVQQGGSALHAKKQNGDAGQHVKQTYPIFKPPGITSIFLSPIISLTPVLKALRLLAALR